MDKTQLQQLHALLRLRPPLKSTQPFPNHPANTAPVAASPAVIPLTAAAPYPPIAALCNVLKGAGVPATDWKPAAADPASKKSACLLLVRHSRLPRTSNRTPTAEAHCPEHRPGHHLRTARHDQREGDDGRGARMLLDPLLGVVGQLLPLHLL
jgi:hypothetical protein